MTVLPSARRTYDDHPLPEDNDKFWTVLLWGVSAAVIVNHQGAPALPETWNWTLHIHAGRFANGIRQKMAIEGSEPSREACFAPLRHAIERYLDLIGPDGWAHHVEHLEWLKERKDATRKRQNRA